MKFMLSFFLLQFILLCLWNICLTQSSKDFLLFSSRSFILAFTFKATTHVKLLYVYAIDWGFWGGIWFCFVYRYPIPPFVKKTILSPMNCYGICIKNQLIYVWAYICILFSVLFIHLSIILSPIAHCIDYYNKAWNQVVWALQYYSLSKLFWPI